MEAKAKNRVRKDNKELMQTMDSLHRIFRGVIEYNENYWSNFLFLILIQFAILINTVLYLRANEFIYL